SPRNGAASSSARSWRRAGHERRDCPCHGAYSPGAVRGVRHDRGLMCGRFTSSQRPETIGERFQVTVPEGYQERFNLAPTQKALIVREREGAREAVMARWGLLPHWAKDERIAYKLINARAETLLEEACVPIAG